MSGLIKFPKGQDPYDNTIPSATMRLRWGDWRVSHVLQVHVEAAAGFEEQRVESLKQGNDPSSQTPPHFVLNGPMHQTAMGLLRHRDDSEALFSLTYLTMLMESLVHTPCPILRTDLIRRVYQEVEELSQKLMIRWQSHEGHFMLPLNRDAQSPANLAQSLMPINNLSDFFDTLKQIARDRHQSLCKKYVFYYPRSRNL